jgi:hypothetical protein
LTKRVTVKEPLAGALLASNKKKAKPVTKQYLTKKKYLQMSKLSRNFCGDSFKTVTSGATLKNFFF